MDTYHVVLYLHLLSLLIGIGAGSILLVCIFQLRNAQTLADAIPWGRAASAVVTLVVAYAVGAAGALWFSRAPMDAPVPATKPTA